MKPQKPILGHAAFHPYSDTPFWKSKPITKTKLVMQKKTVKRGKK